MLLSSRRRLLSPHRTVLAAAELITAMADAIEAGAIATGDPRWHAALTKLRGAVDILRGHSVAVAVTVE